MRRGVFFGWWQVLAALVAQAISAASVFLSYSIVVAPMKSAFSPSQMVLMLGLTATLLAAGVLGPFIGAAIDRLSIRLLMLFGAACLSLGFLLLSLTSAMWQVIIVYMVCMSVGSLLLGQLPTTALLARWFVRRRGMAMGIAASGVAIGGVFVPPLLQFLLDSFEWRDALRLFSVIVLLASAPVIWFLVADRPSDHGLDPDGLSQENMTTTESPLIATPDLVRSAGFWLIVVAVGMIFCGPFALISNMIPFLGSIGFDTGTGAMLLSIYSAASFGGKLLYAAVGDRVNAQVALLAILLVLVLAMILFVSTTDLVLIVVAIIITGASSGAALPMRGVILANIYGVSGLGRIMGLVNMFTMPFTLAAPPLFGLVFDEAGSYSYAIIGYVGLLLCVSLLLTRLSLGSALREAA